MTDSYEYDAFGNTVSTAGSTPNEFFYRGEQLDSDLGLYYLRARYYNPVSGRFLSQDPYPGEIITPSSLHRYRYASGNPTNRVDPFGTEDAVEDEEADSLSEAGGQGARNLANRINCMLYTGASLLDTISPFLDGTAASATAPDQAQAALQIIQLTVDFSKCAADAEAEGPVEGCPLCFAAGTPVHTNHGDVPVESIEVGDEVLARANQTGKDESEPVTALTPKHKDSVLEIRVEGEHAPLRPSTHHPFWARQGDTPAQWINSGDLRIGDRLLTMDGSWRAITAITPVAGEETVYNFTVDKDHDYFVGETGFLVHNAGPCGCKTNRHHYKPKFIGGNPKGPFSTIPSAYHDLITGAFRTAATNRGWGYQYWRRGFPPEDIQKEIMDEVYSQFPCSIDPE